MCSQIITNSWHFIQWGFSTFFFSSNLHVNIYRLICNTIFSDSDVLDTPSWFFFNSAIDVIYFFHFRKNIAIIAAVVSVTTIILIVAIILVLWKSKSITHKCYLIYFVWGKQSKSFPKWLSVNDKVDDQTLHASKTVHAESTI